MAAFVSAKRIAVNQKEFPRCRLVFVKVIKDIGYLFYFTYASIRLELVKNIRMV